MSWPNPIADPLRIAMAAEYESPDAVVRAAQSLRSLGYVRIDGYTPFDVEGLEECLAIGRTKVPAVAFVCGLAGAVIGYGIQWYCNAIDFPINVGGRPLNSAPAFIPITFETTILFAAFGAFFAFFAIGRLPELWNPLFEVDGFERASVDRYWIGIDARDPRFDPSRTLSDLHATAPLRVVVLPVER